MIIVVGNWEIGYNTPWYEAHQFAYAMREFNATELLMTPVTGVKCPDHEVRLREFPSYESMLESCEDLQRVLFEPVNPKQGVNQEDVIWLHDFQHPENCAYVFGSAHYNVAKHKREGDVIVSIKTKRDNGVLWTPQCVGIVLYDRMIKSWQ